MADVRRAGLARFAAPAVLESSPESSREERSSAIFLRLISDSASVSSPSISLLSTALRVYPFYPLSTLPNVVWINLQAGQMEKSGVRRHGLSTPITVCLLSERLDKDNGRIRERRSGRTVCAIFCRDWHFLSSNFAGKCISLKNFERISMAAIAVMYASCEHDVWVADYFNVFEISHFIILHFSNQREVQKCCNKVFAVSEPQTTLHIKVCPLRYKSYI